MLNHVFEKSWVFDQNKCLLVWEKLQRRETFTKGQLPPYKVEFESGLESGIMRPNELNIHHGPFLSVQGAIGEMTETYRDLNYLYGSYVLSYRLIRPTRLEFFRSGTSLTVRLSAQVAPWFKPFWALGLNVFWGCFRYVI